MTDFIPYKNINIHYQLSGKGTTVLLLHGFLENKEMWQFAHNEFSKTHQVLSIDLLGHGKTGCLETDHSMLAMGNAVKAVCDHLKIVTGICLMNSNYFADSQEKKDIRKRANEMVKTQFQNLVRMSFMNLFAQRSIDLFKNEIASVLEQALQTPITGYIKASKGMITRLDYSDFFANLEIPKTIFLGAKDPVMPAKPIIEFCNKQQITYHLLDKGHMSHIEDKPELIHSLREFFEL